MAKLKKLFNWLDDHLEETILIFMILIIAFLTGLQVFMRKVIGSPLTWSEELCRFCYIWTGFISVGYCIRKNSYIRINTFVIMLPKVVQHIINIFTNILSLILYGLFLNVTYRVVIKTQAGGELTSSLNWPSYLIYLGALFGFIFSIIRLAQVIFLEMKNLNKSMHDGTSESLKKGSYLDELGEVISKE